VFSISCAGLSFCNTTSGNTDAQGNETNRVPMTGASTGGNGTITNPVGIAHPIAGYRDSNFALTGVVPYTFRSGVTPVDSLGRTGVVNNASLSASFTSNTVDASVDFSIANQQWLMNAAGMSISSIGGSGQNRFQRQSFQQNANGLNVTKVGCPTCTVTGTFDGAFVLQNLQGAMLGYKINEVTAPGGPTFYTASGGAVFERSVAVTNGAPSPTGRSFILLDGRILQVNDADIVLQNGNLTVIRELKGLVTPSAIKEVTSYAGQVNQSGSLLGGQVLLFDWIPNGGTLTTTTEYGVGGSYGMQFTGNLAQASYLIPALTGAASYTLAASTAPLTQLSQIGTLQNATFNANFTRQSFNTSVGVLMGGTTWNAALTDGPLGTDGSFNVFGSTFVTSSSGGNSAPATITQNGATRSGTFRVAGALTNNSVQGAGYVYTIAASGETVYGAVTFTGANQPIDTANNRHVLTSVYQNAFGGFIQTGGMASPESTVSTDANTLVRRFYSNYDPVSTSIGQVTQLDTTGATISSSGFDAATGFNWGRLSGNVSATDRITGLTSVYAIPGFMHFVSGPAQTGPTTYPQTGTTTYTLVGATAPTDNAGNSGTLNSLTMTADFTNRSVAATVNATVAGTTLVGTTTNARITDNGFAASTGKAVGNLAVTCTGTCGVTHNGQLNGQFYGAGATGAAIVYGMQTLGPGLQKGIVGAAALKR
jgi:hypothetical protein